jgi:hypothetical protein
LADRTAAAIVLNIVYGCLVTQELAKSHNRENNEVIQNVAATSYAGNYIIAENLIDTHGNMQLVPIQ